MKKEDIMNGMSGVNERYAAESRPDVRRKNTRWIWALTAAAAIFAAVFGGYFGVKAIVNRVAERTASIDPTAVPTANVDPTAVPTTLAQPVMLANAEFPATPTGKNYYSFLSGLRSGGSFNAGSDLAGFYSKIVKELLESGENGVCSPYNVYMALAMLSEITAGNTRAQILGLLGADSVESVRAQYSKLFEANYRNSDGMAMTIPAASIWLRDGYIYNHNAIEALKTDYRASSGCGVMGDPAYDALIESWLNEMTHGLLGDSAHDAAVTDPMEVIKLISTLYFKATWSKGFSEKTAEKVFHGISGDKTAAFMEGRAERYLRLDGFTLVGKGLSDGSVMWFALPDEGRELDSLIASGDALSVILSGQTDTDGSFEEVFLNMPELDIGADYSLIGALESLGVTDCFDPYRADFTPLTDDPDLYVSRILHSARVIADREGVVGAALTVIDVPLNGMPSDPEITVTLDRPFMFFVMSADNTPLFVGTVSDL